MSQKKTITALKASLKEASHSNRGYAEYQVRAADNISLSLQFGTAGVVVTTDAWFMKRFLYKDVHTDIQNLAIGKGADILGERLAIYCLLTNTAAMGNSKTLKVDLKISGGAQVLSQSYSQTVPQAGGSYLLQIDILFIR